MTTDSQKVALVTGGARGIGKATVDRLVREGLKVVATDISPNNDLLNNAHVLSHAHDVSSSESWSSVLDVVSKKFGRLDILVNNAGIGTLPDIEEEDESGWQEMLDVNANQLAWHQGCHPAHAFQSFWFNS